MLYEVITCVQTLQRRHDFLLVVGVLGEVRFDDQVGSDVNAGLGIEGLLEAPAGARHDARFLVGEVDLVFGPRAGRRGLGLFSSCLLAGLLLIGLALGPLAFVLGLLALSYNFV